MARKDRKDRGLFTRTLKDGQRVWGVRIAVHGRMLRFSPFKHKGEARAFYEKAKTEQREGRFFPERYHARGPSVQSFIDRYMPTTRTKKTALEEVTFAARWGKWYEGRSVASIHAEDLEAARRAMLDGTWAQYGRKLTRARANRYTQWLHQVFAHPVNRPHLPLGRNPVDTIKKYSEPRPPRHIASPEEERQLIARLEQETPGVTNWVRLSIICGLRQGELFGRLKCEVDTALWVFVIPRAKHQDEPKIIQIPPSARPYVRTLLASSGPWLIPHPADPRKPFPVKQWYKTKYRRAVLAVRLPKTFNWHSLRHTFASRMLAAGASTHTVRHAGGWSSERMVDQIYGQLSNQFVADAMERAVTVAATVTPPVDSTQKGA